MFQPHIKWCYKIPIYQLPRYRDVGTLENTYLRKAGLRIRYYMFVGIMRVIPLKIKFNPLL